MGSPSRRYYRAALARAAVAGTIVIAGNAGLVAALVAAASDPAAAWADLLRAGGRCVEVFGAFASVVLIALLFWLAPVRELRIIPTVTVLGPLTLLRPFVVAGGLLFAAAGASTWRVWLVAAVAGTSMLAFEHVLGRRYADRWRRLV